MGAKLCCAQKGATEDVLAPTAENENGHVSEGFLYEDKEGADIFFSARQSLSQMVSGLPYPPTATPKSGRSRNVTVELPKSLLQVGDFTPTMQLHANKSTDAVDQNNAKQYSESTSSSIPLKRPTDILTGRLTEEFKVGAGYPGELSNDELQACLEFRRRLNEHIDPTYRKMVYLNVDVDLEADEGDAKDIDMAGRGPEEEAFALCRFLRARQFDVEKTFAMMGEHVDMFREALTSENLYRSKTYIEDHIGCPIPVFTKQFPMLDYGLAKNGAFVVYMKAGLIRLQEGFDCISTTETPESFIARYIPVVWYVACQVFCETMHRLQKERQNNDNETDFVVLAEAVVVIDLEGLQRELFTKRTMEFMQQSFGVIQCFPEILNRVVVVNVPYFFTFIWSVLKRFIDARTVQKIGFFSSLSAAQEDLLDLVLPCQLLQDYGGKKGNPTYEEALDLKLKRDGRYKRYIFESYTKETKMPPGSTSITLKAFSLNETEEADLTVYTQYTFDAANSKNWTQFVLLPVKSSPPDAKATKDNMNALTHSYRDGSSSKRLHRFGQPTATSADHCSVVGPGNFRLVVKKTKGGPVIEKALLVISIR